MLPADRHAPVSQFLLDLAAGRPPSAPPSQPGLVSLAARHGLLGFLSETPLPAGRKAEALGAYGRLLARQEVMERHLRRLLERLSKARIPVAVVKGPGVAGWAYARPEMRTFTDLDLVVPSRYATSARDLLLRDETLESGRTQRARADKHDVVLRDPLTRLDVPVDLHWDLFSYHQLRRCADGAVDEAFAGSTWTDTPLGPQVLLPEDIRVAFLCTHTLLDHRFRLILFRDLLELSAKGVDWEALARFGERWQVRSFLWGAWLLARRWVGAEVPSWFLEATRVEGLAHRAFDRLTGRVDPVTFDGRKPHPLNLAAVLMHDDRAARKHLAIRAPAALPGWSRRVDSMPKPAADPSVLVVITSDERRGAQVFGSQLTETLRWRGWRASILALTSTAEGAKVDVPALADGRLGPLDRRIVGRLREKIREEQPDVVLANGSATLKYLATALLGLRRRPALVYASIGEPGYWLARSGRPLFQRLLHRRPDLIAAVSKETRGQLIEMLGVPPDRVRVAETGVPPTQTVRGGTRGDLLRLVWVGSLSEEKDPAAALEVLDALVSRGVSAELTFVGSGDLVEAVEEEVAARGLVGRVRLVGAVENVIPFLADADLLLLSSRTEGLPGVVLEAGLAGIPTAAFEVGGVSEVVVDGTTGLLAPPGDAKTLAEAIREAVGRDALRELGEEARRLVMDRFLLEHAVDRYQAVLQEAIELRKQPQ